MTAPDAPQSTTRRPRGALVAGTGLLAGAVLLGSLVAAGDLRADRAAAERAAAAARAEAQAEARAEVAYRAVVERASAALYDQLQPLQAAMERTLDGEAFGALVLDDVAGHLAGADATAPARALLEAADVPKARADVQAALLAALDDTRKAVGQVAEVEGLEEEGQQFEALADADLALDAATRAFATPLVAIFPADAKPVQPDVFGGESARPALSHASYLDDAGAVCAKSLGAYLDALDKGGRGDERVLRLTADRLDRDVPALLGVKAATPQDAKVARSIRAPLRGVTDLTAGARSLLSAVQRRNGPEVRAAQARLTRGGVAAVKAARGYREFGSRTCSLYFVGLDEDGGEDAPDAGSAA